MVERLTVQRFGGVVATAILVAGCAAAPSPVPTIGATPIATPAATSIATSTPAPTVIPTAAGTAVPAGWHAAPIQDWFATVQFDDVTWTGARFVATVIGPGDGGGFADSADGINWHLQASSAADWRPDQIAAGGSGIVAIGQVGDANASWFSTDGLTWTPSRDAFRVPSLGTDAVFVQDVVARGGGWLAIGSRDAGCAFDCESDPIRAYIWTSTDGRTWTREADQASLKGAGMAAVAAVGDGFVAAGVASSHAAIWTSSDATTWSRVPDAPVFHDGVLANAATGVATVGGTIAVVGSAYAQDSCAPGAAAKLCPGARGWWSSDGKNWTKAAIDLPIDGQVFGATATPVGLLAVGPSGACLGGMWSSTDGRSWTCAATDPTFAGFGPYAAAASSTIEVAVGLTSAGWDESGDLGMPGSIWVRALP
ncbi:MAG: hypothetical protein QOI92_774 [Chloroflexota bacterium]|jgi:hypothetical protein|nr:hypothetical protein [Chloroflexota bacterium]